MRSDIFEVLEYTKEQNIPASIVTNSLLITKDKAKKLNALNLSSITVSIDGLEKSHDFIRGKGNFRKTYKKIKLLKKYIHTAELSIRVTVNTKNVNECQKLIKLAENLKADSIRLTPVLPIGRAKENLDLLMSQEQYQKFLNDCHNIKTKIQVILPDNNSNVLNTRTKGFGCHCGKEVCWITQVGDLYPCIFFGEKFIVGNMKKEKFSILWERSRKKVMFYGNKCCKNCFNYKNCRGGCRARALWLYNDINEIDPYCPFLNKNKNSAVLLNKM